MEGIRDEAMPHIPAVVETHEMLEELHCSKKRLPFAGKACSWNEASDFYPEVVSQELRENLKQPFQPPSQIRTFSGSVKWKAVMLTASSLLKYF